MSYTSAYLTTLFRFNLLLKFFIVLVQCKRGDTPNTFRISSRGYCNGNNELISFAKPFGTTIGFDSGYCDRCTEITHIDNELFDPCSLGDMEGANGNSCSSRCTRNKNTSHLWCYTNFKYKTYCSIVLNLFEKPILSVQDNRPTSIPHPSNSEEEIHLEPSEKNLYQYCQNMNQMQIQIIKHKIFFSTILKETQNFTCGRFYEVRYVNIFIKDTIVIDCDFHRVSTGLKQLSIVSPIWIIDGERLLNLSGIDPIEIEIEHEMPDSSNGKSGRPGENGADFFGIGLLIKNMASLTVISDGGNGMSGSDGAWGEHSFVDVDADWNFHLDNRIDAFGATWVNASWINDPDFIRDFQFILQDDLSSTESCRGENLAQSYCYSDHTPFREIGAFGCYRTEMYACLRFKAYNSSSAGSGGHGGHGGRGGKGGRIVLSETHGFPWLVSKGNMGRSGQGGTGGIGGRTFHLECLYNGNSWYIRCEYNHDKMEIFEKSEKFSLDGLDGKKNTMSYVERDIQSFIKPLIEYKHIIAEFLMTSSNLSLFLNELIEQPLSLYLGQNFYELSVLADEFISFILSFNYFRLPQRIILRFLRNIYDLLEGLISSNDLTENYFCFILKNAIRSQILSVISLSEQILITNVTEFIRTVADRLSTIISNANKTESISQLQKKYKEDIESKISEAKMLVEDVLCPRLENAKEILDDQIERFEHEIKQWKAEDWKEWKQILDKIEQAKTAGCLKTLLCVVQVIGASVSFIAPPISSVIGGAITAGASIAKGFVKGPTSVAISEGMAKAIYAINHGVAVRRQQILQDLDAVTNALNDPVFEDTKHSINEKISNVQSSNGKINFNAEILSNTWAEVSQELIEKQSQLEKSAATTKTIMMQLQNAMQFVNAGTELYNTFAEINAEVEGLEGDLATVGNNIRQLDQFQEEVVVTIGPMLSDMMDSLIDQTGELNQSCLAVLDVIRWDAARRITQFERQLETRLGGFEIDPEIINTIEESGDVLQTIIQIFDRIQTYREQQKIADFIGNMVKTQFQDEMIHKLPSPQGKILSNAIQKNMITGEYNRAIGAFRQWVFPFAGMYLGKFQDNELGRIQTFIELNQTSLLNQMVSELVDLSEQMQKYKIMILDSHETNFRHEVFYDGPATDPFYTFTHTEHEKAIKQLLGGKKVAFYADIKKVSSKKSAVKFQNIGLSFKLTNQNNTFDENILTERLRSYEIHMTHTGNSYYKYAGKTYIIAGKELKLIFGFEQSKYAGPGRSFPSQSVTENNIYRKLAAGDLMLSPYTTWIIQLVPRKENIDSLVFGLDLKTHQIDLQLVGTGSWVDHTNIKLDLEVDNYYYAIEAYDKVRVSRHQQSSFVVNQPSFIITNTLEPETGNMDNTSYLIISIITAITFVLFLVGASAYFIVKNKSNKIADKDREAYAEVPTKEVDVCQVQMDKFIAKQI